MKAADGVLFVAATFLLSNFDPINFPSDRRDGRSVSPSVFLLQFCTLFLLLSLPSFHRLSDFGEAAAATEAVNFSFVFIGSGRESGRGPSELSSVRSFVFRD